MTRSFLLALIFFLIPSALCAQTLDKYLGDTTISCPASLDPNSPGYSVTATCSQLTTNVTCTLPTGQGANFSTTIEPIRISGSSTALDTVDNDTSNLGGQDVITSIVGDTITLTSPVSATVSSTSVSFADGHFYVPRDASGNVVTVAVPGWGNRFALCTPQRHFFYMFTVSNPCVQYTAGTIGCGPSLTSSTANTTRLSNVASIVIGAANFRWNVGAPIQVTNCVDTTYNTATSPPPHITSVSSNGLTLGYENTGPDDATGTTGCKIKGLGWDTKYASFGGTQPTSSCNTQLGQFTRYEAIGFNTVGEDGDDFLNPTRTSPCNVGPSNSNTHWFPIFMGQTTPAASNDAAQNDFGCATQGEKAPLYTIIPAVTNMLKNSAVVYDWADPHWTQWLNCNWNPSTGRNPFTIAEVPWEIGFTFDDTDGMMQTHASGVWQNWGAAGPSPEPSLLVLYGAPYISTSDHSNIGGKLPRLYPDTCNYSKDLATDCGLSAPSSCTSAAPCSLADYLRVKYGTIAALNTAWGTTYTSFGSSRSVFTGEAITTPASYTFAHTNVTPRSVQIFETPSGGSPIMVTGSCSFGDFDCPAGTAGQADFLSAPTCTISNTPYMTAGIVCLDTNGDIEEVTTGGTTGTSATWPLTTNCSGTQTTTAGTVIFTCIGPGISGTMTYSTGVSAFTIGGAGSLPTGETLTTNYSTGGWSLGGTGLEDEDGTGTSGHGITLINGVNLVCPETYATGITTTAYKTEVAFTNTAKTWWAIALTAGTTSDPAPAFTTNMGDIVTGSDGIQWEMLGQPVSDATNAFFNGFSTPCAPFNATNATIAGDLQDYEQQFFDFYFKGLHSVSAPYHVLNFGANFGGGSYNGPTWLGGLQAANTYTDALFMGSVVAFTPFSSSYPLDHLTLNYIFRTFRHPAAFEFFMASCAGDWQGNAKTCSPAPASSPTQGQFNGLTTRANGFYTTIQSELNYTDLNGERPWFGHAWWTDHQNDNGSNTGETSFSLLDYSDNRIDGHENVAASTNCSSPLSSLTGCGGELSTVPWLGVDQEHCTGTAFLNKCISDGLALPFNGAPITPTTAPVHNIIWGDFEYPILF